MNTGNLAHLEWSLVQTFIAVADEGSLTGAAKRLGQSQPTIGRHIARAEEVLGVALFTRARRGLELTDVGTAILPAARDMAAVMANFVVSELIVGIRRAEPNIELELHASDTTENLLFHDADIAVRMYRPEQLDIITKHIGDMRLGLFAAQSYLERRGTPKTLESLMEHDWIGYDKSELMIMAMREMGWDVGRSFFGLRCDDQAAYWRLLVAGGGIGAGQEYVAAQHPSVTRIMPSIEIPPIPVWLTAPAILRQSPRIRRVYDLLAEGLRGVSDPPR